MRILILLLLIGPTFCTAQKVNSKQFSEDCGSIIQFYGYEREIQRNEENIALYFAAEGGDSKEGKKLIADVINDEKKLRKKILNTPVSADYQSLKTQTVDLMNIIISCFEKLYQFGQDSKEFKTANNIYQPKLEKHLNDFWSKFGHDNYLQIDSASAVNIQRIAYNISFKEKDKADILLKNQQPIEAYKEVISNNDLRSDIVLLYLSDILLKKKYSDSINSKINYPDSIAVLFLEKIINKNSYSPLLFEAWRKWRAQLQVSYGASKTSDIPNDLYDEKRFMLMNIIASYVKQNSSDMWAYLQFFNLAEIEIIHRFGPYPYGNQSAVERNELFYKD